MMNINQKQVKEFIDYLHKNVSDEFSFRVYPYQKVDILVAYFRGLKFENWQLDRNFFMMDDKERWHNVIRLRRRVTVVKQPKDWRIAREVATTAKQVANNKKYMSAIPM